MLHFAGYLGCALNGMDLLKVLRIAWKKGQSSSKKSVNDTINRTELNWTNFVFSEKLTGPDLKVCDSASDR